MDLFIGEPDYVGKGWGRLIIVRFLNEIAFPMFPEEEVCWILHDKMNKRAIRASRAAGFRCVRDALDHQTLHEVLVVNKSEVARLAHAIKD
jgi:hypothetical protein